MTTTKEIEVGSKEFDEVLDNLYNYFSSEQEEFGQQLSRSRATFREYCIEKIVSIAAQLGYIIKNIQGFFSDVRGAWEEGWQKGADRACKKRKYPQ
jgi:hypothetical protein